MFFYCMGGVFFFLTNPFFFYRIVYDQYNNLKHFQDNYVTVYYYLQ